MRTDEERALRDRPAHDLARTLEHVVCSVRLGFSSPQTWMPSISVPDSFQRGLPAVSDASR